MPHAFNQIEWCLNKAKKEIEECKKAGKRLKHRGLVKGKPDIEEAKRHLAKAEHNMDGITVFKKDGFSDWSMSAGFYCIYHCFLAIASRFGYESGNQTCTIALMRHLKEEKKISLDDRFIELLDYEDIDSIIDMREDYTYGVQVSVENEAKISKLKAVCKELIDVAKEIVFS